MNKLFSFLKKLFKRSVDERRYAVSHLKTTAFIAGERIEQGQVVHINPDNGRVYVVRLPKPKPIDLKDLELASNDPQ
jgi:predicted transcriptional regulator